MCRQRLRKKLKKRVMLPNSRKAYSSKHSGTERAIVAGASKRLSLACIVLRTYSDLGM